MSSYIGRFAPSPTGPLHFGSLLAALASYLDAKHHQGRWLVRIEDLDPPREDPNAAAHILSVLDCYGLHWDGEVVYQSQRSEIYTEALDQLRQQNKAFPCACSRKQLLGKPHQGLCSPPMRTDYAWRLLCPDGTRKVSDGLQADQHYNLQANIGDFVIRRRDGLWSYQLAVVVDDAEQQITHVVRGIDLIDSTIRQQLLQQALGYAIPSYSHIPVAIETNGQKLSKQNLALALKPDTASATLWQALHWLEQHPPADLQGAPCKDILNWGSQHWNSSRLSHITEKPAPENYRRAIPEEQIKTSGPTR
jgi:glutamyl-Q tRNA(Asp) synthetase